MPRLDENEGGSGYRRIRWLQVLIAFLVGAGVTMAVMVVVCDRVIYEYVMEDLNEQSRNSQEAFVRYPQHYPHEISTGIQVGYLTELSEARENGWISEQRFHEGAALASVRACIINEEEGIEERSEQFCKWAQQHWSKLDSTDDFASVRRREEAFRERMQSEPKDVE